MLLPDFLLGLLFEPASHLLDASLLSVVYLVSGVVVEKFGYIEVR